MNQDDQDLPNTVQITWLLDAPATSQNLALGMNLGTEGRRRASNIPKEKTRRFGYDDTMIEIGGYKLPRPDGSLLENDARRFGCCGETYPLAVHQTRGTQQVEDQKEHMMVDLKNFSNATR